jgi:hypothetical protein
MSKRAGETLALPKPLLRGDGAFEESESLPPGQTDRGKPGVMLPAMLE